MLCMAFAKLWLTLFESIQGQKSLRKVLEGQDQAGPIMENPQHFLRVICVLHYVYSGVWTLF